MVGFAKGFLWVGNLGLEKGRAYVHSRVVINSSNTCFGFFSMQKCIDSCTPKTGTRHMVLSLVYVNTVIVFYECPRYANGSLSSSGSWRLAPMISYISLAVSSLSHAIWQSHLLVVAWRSVPLYIYGSIYDGFIMFGGSNVQRGTHQGTITVFFP